MQPHRRDLTRRDRSRREEHQRRRAETSEHLRAQAREQQRRDRAGGNDGRERQDVHRRHVVPDRVEQRAARGAQHRDRQRRRQRARHRHVERGVGDDHRVRRPAPAPQTQHAIDQPEGRADRGVVPVVRRDRPDRPRQIAPRQRQRLRQHERRRQAQRADEVMRVRRFSSSHETMTDVEDALAGAFQIQSWTMTRRAGGRS